MTATLTLAVEAGSGDQSNRHIAAFLERLAEEKLEFHLIDMADDPAIEDADAYFPATEGNAKTILRALTAGVKVFLNNAAPESAEGFRDFIQGYVRNGEAEWFARLFPEPIHVADPAKLLLDLGVTVNPRAIILNAGIDGKGGVVSIGRASHLGADLLLNLGPTDFSVGKFSLISARFSAHAMRHSMSHISNFAIRKGPFGFFGEAHDRADPLCIGNDVWIGYGVTCLPGVEIGNGCVVGAGSVVTASLEPYGVYAGNPARLLRYRFEPEKIEALNGIAWWDLEFDKLREIDHLFKCDITQLSADQLHDLF